VQAPASAGCADWLRRAAGAALPVVGSPIFTVPVTAVSARVPTLALGLSSAQEQPWKFSIAPACFGAGSSGCERPAIPLGDRYRMTKIRTRNSVGARYAA
jgi:hypothetical protein